MPFNNVLPIHSDALSVFKGVNLRRLEAILGKDHPSLVSLLKDCCLLPTERRCSRCGKECFTYNDKTNWAGYSFQCIDKACKKRSSSMTSTFFSCAKISPDDVIRLLYYFAREEYKYERLKHEMARDDGKTLGDHSIADWISFFREVCAVAIEDNHQLIGGVGREVQIDESCFVKYKHNRGLRLAKQRWVFGGVDADDKNQFFACIVERRDKETLLPLIQAHIAPGTKIVSDGWAAYREIDKLPEGYTHEVVNHSKCFKDPETGAHTNAIEGAWMHMKQPLKRAHGRSRSTLIPSLNEFVFRRRYAGTDIFHALLVHITKVYDVNESPDGTLNGYEAAEVAAGKAQPRVAVVRKASTQDVTGEEEKETDDDINIVIPPKRGRESTPDLFPSSPEPFPTSPELFQDSD